MQVQPNSVLAPSAGPGDANRPATGGGGSFGTMIASSMSMASGSDSKAVAQTAQDHSAEITTAAKSDSSPKTKLALRLAFKASRKSIADNSLDPDASPNPLPNAQSAA